MKNTLKMWILAFAILLGANVHADTAAEVNTYCDGQLPTNGVGGIQAVNLRNCNHRITANIGSMAPSISTINISATNISISGTLSVPSFTAPSIATTNLAATNVSASAITAISLNATSVTTSGLIANTISGSYTASGTSIPVPLSLSDEISILSFGAKCDGVTNDAPAIQAAINWPTSATITGPKAVCKVNNPITVAANTKNYRWGGATWDMTAITSSTTASSSAVTFVAPQTAQATYFNQNSFDNLNIEGLSKDSGVDGITFATHNIVLRNVNVNRFRRCHSYVANSYIIDQYSNNVLRCQVGVYMPSGLTNYGEKISYFGGVFAGNEAGFYWNNSNGDLYLNNVSNDYNNGTPISPTASQFGTIDGGRVHARAPHWESTLDTLVAPVVRINDGNGTGLYLDGGVFTFTGTSANASATSLFDVNGRGFLKTTNMFWHNTALPNGCLTSGNGTIDMGESWTYTVAQMNNCLTASVTSTLNLMTDGGFEKTALPLADLVTIMDDTVAVVSQTAGTNISLTLSTDTAFDGTQSLKVTKAGGSGTRAKFRIFIPVSEVRATFVGGFYLSKLDAHTGSVFLNTEWVKVNPYLASGTIPTIVSTTAIGGATVAFTSATTPWYKPISTSPGPTTRAPRGATHLSVLFNMDSMQAGSFYIDNVIWGKM